MKSLQYEIHIPTLLEDGHPHLEFASSANVAAQRFDELSEVFKEHEVQLYFIEKKLVKKSIPIVRTVERPTKCKHGHSGLIDGKPILVEGSKGHLICSICGWREGE